MKMQDDVKLNIAPMFSLHLHNRKMSSTANMHNILFPSECPRTLPVELSEPFNNLLKDMYIALGTNFASHDIAAQYLLALGRFDLLNRMDTAEMINDWEGLFRFVLSLCKDTLNRATSLTRINWVFYRASLNDVAMVAKDFFMFVDDDVYTCLIHHGFPRHEKTMSAIKLAIKSE